MSRTEREPSRAELRAIEAEWPVIAAELAVVDAEIAEARSGDHASELAAWRVRRAQARLAREIAVRARCAGDLGGAA